MSSKVNYTGSGAPMRSMRSVRFSRSQTNIANRALQRTLSRAATKSSLGLMQKKASSHFVFVENENDEWVRCKVTGQEGSVYHLEEDCTGNKLTVDASFRDVHPCNSNVVTDMTHLRHLHEPAILHNLRERYSVQQPYTFMGSVLVSVNPFEWLEEVDMDKYVGKLLDPDDPHPYAIAELCYQQICVRSPLNQSVVISGESGAGKTEAAKMVLSYIVHRASIGSNVEEKLIKSSPILEAFGNARTVRNLNSSRFGKYMRIYLNPSTEGRDRSIAGAAIETYLLEKSRVIDQSTGERNFHAYYCLLAAKQHSEPETESIQISSSPTDYSILSFCGDKDTIGSLGTIEQYREVVGCMRSLQFGDRDVIALWSILGAVLEIGNIEFRDEDTSEGEAAVISTENECSLAANLLGISSTALSDTLTKRVITTRGESYTKSMNSKDSANARNALCKFLYEFTFTTIVSVINRCLAESTPNANTLNSIGVLDIFGFESFKRNEFEQLLINYANEVLQSTFNQQVFQSELRLYKEENIFSELSEEECPNNSHCVSIIYTKPPAHSILGALVSACQVGNGSDEVFFENLHKSFGTVKDPEIRKIFPKVHPKDQRRIFTVCHFAGSVTYTVSEGETNSWLMKNNDDIPAGTIELLGNSENGVIKSFTAQNIGSSTIGRRSSIRKVTVVDRFTASMSTLCSTLSSSTCSFIRCIKPNPRLLPREFDTKYSIDQIRSLGLVQVCAVMKVGLPMRISFEEIRSILGPIATDMENLFIGEPEEVFIASLLWALDIPQNVYHLGRTRIFLKSGQIETFDKIISTDFKDQRGAIQARLEEALRARAECKEMLRDLSDQLEEVLELAACSRNIAESLAVSSMEVGERVKALKGTFNSVKALQIDEVMNTLAISQQAISDVEVYGEDVKSSEHYDVVQKIIDNAKSQLKYCDSVWHTIDTSAALVEDFCASGSDASIGAMMAQRWEELQVLEDSLRDCQRLMQQISLECNHCIMSSVESKVEECENDLGIIKYRFKKFVVVIGDGEKAVSTTGAGISDMDALVETIRTMSADAKLAAHKIMQLCEDAKQSTTQIRDKIANDAAEREAREVEAKEREESERKRREIEEFKAIEDMRLQREADALRQATTLARSMPSSRYVLDSEDTLSQSDEEVCVSTESLQEAEEAIANELESEDLPPGWKRDFDNTFKSNCYINTLTDAVQFVRPTSPAKVSFEKNPTEKLEREGLQCDESESQSSLDVQLRTMDVDEDEEVVIKKGTLQKQGRVFGMWKKKCMVLRGSVLEQYESSASYVSGAATHKRMVLSDKSELQFGGYGLSFTVSTEDVEWTFLAENKRELDAWLKCIRNAIIKLYDDRFRNICHGSK